MTATGQPEAEPSSESKPDEERAAEENVKRQRLDLYSVRLRADQIGYLKSLPNASEWLRAAIDSACAKEAAASPAERAVLLSRELRNVKAEIRRLLDEGRPSYQACEGLAARIESTDAAIDGHQKIVDSNLEGVKGSVAQRKSVEALPNLEEEKARLEHEYAVQNTVMQAFLDKIHELEARQAALEEQLLGQGETGKKDEAAGEATV